MCTWNYIATVFFNWWPPGARLSWWCRSANRAEEKPILSKRYLRSKLLLSLVIHIMIMIRQVPQLSESSELGNLKATWSADLVRTLRELRTLDRAAFSYLRIRNQDHLHHYDDDKVMIMLIVILIIKVKWSSFWSSRLTSGNDSLLWALAWRAKQPDGYKDDEEDDYNVEKNNHDDGNIEILNWFQFPTKETGKKREKKTQEKSSLRKSSSNRIDKKIHLSKLSTSA